MQNCAANRKMKMSRTVEQEYKDWVALLKARNAEDLLKDPYNVWLEAWSIATLLAKEAAQLNTEKNQPH